VLTGILLSPVTSAAEGVETTSVPELLYRERSPFPEEGVKVTPRPMTVVAGSVTSSAKIVPV
jgi:hypothetical protein